MSKKTSPRLFSIIHIGSEQITLQISEFFDLTDSDGSLMCRDLGCVSTQVRGGDNVGVRDDGIVRSRGLG